MENIWLVFQVENCPSVEWMKNVMGFPSENSVFKFLQHSVNRAYNVRQIDKYVLIVLQLIYTDQLLFSLSKYNGTDYHTFSD